ncbi:MAG TPA: hypothetical protein VME86_02300 [Acidobacteriaceae bacterium]|nr:hypothetical protein [Acidobacteriaceae bacterium]
MPETGSANIEIAKHLTEGAEHGKPDRSRMLAIVEVLEAVILALVACATAWSGYQAARWDSQQSLLYGQSTKLRARAEGLEVLSNQERQYDAATVDEWLEAQARGDTKLAELFERRLLPEFRPAFDAWKKTDPLHNQNAPAGPSLMPEYRNAAADEAARLQQEASELFERGTSAREWGDNYVRVTVTLATVLLLTAISQRFRIHKIRVALIVLALLLLCFPLLRILMFPRA